MKVLIVEDDIQLNTTLRKYLELHKYQVVSIYDGKEAIDIIGKEKFDLYIIDINLPSVDGIELIEYIRKKDIINPIIMITASLEIDNFIQAYEKGCNEYIKKPFHFKELEIRINNLLDKEKDILYVTDRICYDFKYEELKIDGKVVHLRKKANRLLQILLKNLNHAVKTEEIISYVWENEIKETYPLRQLVTGLRREFNTGKNHIISVTGIGYKFEV
jgi:DNA-binding response OmpR family regulator